MIPTDESRIPEENFNEFKLSHWDISVSKKLFRPSPLAKLITKEGDKLMKRKLWHLRSLLKDRLSIIEYAFLRTLLGKNWHNRMYLPGLEYVDDVSKYVSEKLPEVRERLQILMAAMPTYGNQKGMALYLASRPYFLMTEKEVVDVYHSILNNGARPPYGFFKYDDGRKSGILTRYMYEKLMGLKPEEVFARATKRDFRENKLDYMLQTQFRDSVQDAVRNAYPRLRYPELYKRRNGDDTNPNQLSAFGGLAHLVDSLDEVFGSNQPLTPKKLEIR